ncbi:DRTGG domain protein [Synechococcus sp. PCC 7335]|uniref:phosphotransacetylase family protein n=1 Tax=Synechococcus sp. (strain ATCC 29403 / PCC 7335) TaxID=91464 RepID=UPI00017EDCEF|nr:phosphotransacetylase family protein [Synechococcus sp. PCC 7335]EDX86146.1 DRTGG domain protein [Synechococcus sp. PCC 7335]
MPQSLVRTSKQLLIGSVEAYSGKSATVLGLAVQLRSQGLDVAYAKPIGTCPSEDNSDSNLDEDVRFISQTLELGADRIRPTLFVLDEPTIQQQLSQEQRLNGPEVTTALAPQGEDILLMEGPGNLEEGSLFGLSLPDIAETTQAAVMLVARYHSTLVVDKLLAAKKKLGDKLIGVVINDVPKDLMKVANTSVRAYLERHDIKVFGILPRTAIMRSVSVGALVDQLNAEILNKPERIDQMMVEEISIGAMNANSALRYFNQAHNMVVVTGGDRFDIQMAALESSTQCLVLTGRLSPRKDILDRANDVEVPILSVDFDTLTTVDKIEQAFDQVRLHEPIKVACIKHLMEQHFDIERMMNALGLAPAVTA